MMTDPVIDEISQAIINTAKLKIEAGEPYQNINSAIHGVIMEIQQEIMEFMRKEK